MAKVTNAPESRASLRSDLDARDPFVSWQIVDLQFPEEPNTDMVIPHNLRINHPRDVHYRVVKQFTRGSVYESAAADAKQWTSNFIVLRSDTPGWTGRLLLGVLTKVLNFPIESFEVPEQECDPCNPDGPLPEVPEGEECISYCTTTGASTAMMAADGVSITPSGVSWTSSAWVEIEAVTATDWILTDIHYIGGEKATGNFFEIDIGIGADGEEAVVATMPGIMGSAAATSADANNNFTFPMPADVVPAGSRVVARVRQVSTDTTDWRVSLGYYEKPINEQDSFPTALTGPTCFPIGASPIVVSPNTTAWADSDWHELTASTGSAWFLGGLLVHGPTCEWEIDVGIGAEDEEVVLTTLRGQTQYAFRDGAGYHCMFKPVLDAIPEGSRISVRQRKSGTSATTTSVKAIFHRDRVRSYTTNQPMLVWPAAADALDITADSPFGSYGDWVEFEDLTGSPVAIVGLHSGRAAGTLQIQIGTGLIGEEEVIGTWGIGQGISTAGGWQKSIVLPMAVYIPSGRRIVARMAVAGGGGGARTLAISYIENPAFTNVTDGTAKLYTIVSMNPPGVWTNSDWEVLANPVAEDIRMVGWWDVAGGSSDDFEIDLGIGADGEEVVITTYRFATGAAASGAGGRAGEFAIPHCIDAGVRLVARARTTSGEMAAIGFSYVTNNGDEIGECGPEAPEGEDDGGSESGITTPSTTTNNAIARWDGIVGGGLKDSNITIADAATPGTLSGTNSGDVTLAGTPDYITIAGQVITRSQIDLTADVTGDLPLTNLAPSVAASKLLGRGDSGAGDWQAITLGTGLSMTGTTLASSGGSGAPDDADYLVRTAHAGLSAERVVTDTTSVVWDWATAGQAKATRAALTGDVTAGADSNSTTIANDAVTYAKMQDVSAGSKLLGRGDSGSGNVEEITLGSGLTMTGTTLASTGTGAPDTADYLVRTANGSLSAERVVTDTTSIIWDWATGGQAKATRAALTGDVTASADSNSTTIANDAVTYAKMQDISAASKLLGRGSASGSGNTEEITIGSGLSMTGTTLAASASAAVRVFGIVINGGATPPVTGVHGETRVPFSGTITKVTLLGDVSGAAVVDIWKAAFGSYPPVVGGSIITGGGTKPTLAGLTYEDSTLSNWTVAVTAGDTYRFNLDSVTTCTRLTLIIEVTL